MPRPLDVLDEIRAIMDRGHIAPTPANYEFCHRYVTNSDPLVWHAVSEAIATDGRLTPEALTRIQLAAARADQGPGSDAFLARVSKQIAEVQTYLSDAKGSTESYGLTLENSRSEMNGGDPRLGKLLEGLAAATDAMVTQTATLKARLDTSSEEVATMHRELEKARRDTLRDALTGLPNRRAFDQQIAEAFGKACPKKAPLTLAFCDVDHFKKFNDTWGHRVGDDVLKLVGVRMVDNFQSRGFSARYGGEEFVAILPGLNAPDAFDIADAFRRSISARSLKMRGDGRDIGRVTISVGLASLKPGDDLETLVERADAALYQAKTEGRDRVVVAA